MNGRPAAFCPESTRWSCRFQIGPAWAKIVSADQPRTCGEYSRRRDSGVCYVGSAPHMRGIPRLAAADGRGPRISPAHAGNTIVHSPSRAPSGDQPRTCGEYRGSRFPAVCQSGSAPHMRGILGESRKINPKPRISPAHAGNTLASVRQCSTAEDQPRTCGEYDYYNTDCPGPVGSAPHLRGIPGLPGPHRRLEGISPAHAGNTARAAASARALADQPCTCGEYLTDPRVDFDDVGSAPHMRGIRSRAVYLARDFRISPAHAGNTIRCH